MWLNYLQYVENSKLPNIIGRYLDLTHLESTDGFIIPKGFHYKSLYAYHITMQDLIDKSLENEQEISKQRGFTKFTLLVILNIVISLGMIILGVYFTR